MQEAGLVRRTHPGSRAALRVLALVCIVLVTHGSLYPWRFEWPAWPGGAVLQMLTPERLWTGLGDVAGNVALFVPLGALGKLLLDQDARPAPRLRLPGLLVFGVAFAFVLQVAQIFVPSRNAAISDVLWNALGLLVGVGLAGLTARLSPLAARAGSGVPGASLAVIGLWLAIEWWPFVPTIDWQHVKDALKPLFLKPRWTLDSAVEVGLSVAVVAHLLRATRLRARLLSALIALAVVAKLLISGQSLSLSHATGLVGGLILGIALWRTSAWRAAIGLIWCALAWVTIDALRPYELAGTAATFHWIPFVALLKGSLISNVLALTWNLFWLGAVLVLARETGARVAPLAIGLAAWVLALEALQIWLPGRTADITPALLPFVWMVFLEAIPAPAVGVRTSPAGGIGRE